MRALILASFLLAQAAAGPQVTTGMVTGIIRNVDGSPAPNVRVTAATGLGGVGVGVAYVSIAESNESGRYRLEGIPPGRYFIMAGRIDLPTFYPGTMDSSAARPVSIAAGALVADIDFPIDPASVRPPQGVNPPPANPVRRVSGRFVVEDRPGGPTLVISPGKVSAHPVNGPAITVESASDGTFTLRLEGGDYRVTVTAPRGHVVKSVLFGATDLSSQPFKVDASFSLFTSGNFGRRPLDGFGSVTTRSGPEIVVTLALQSFRQA